MTYVYKCSAKHPHVTEVEQKMGESPLDVCQHKGCNEPAHRIIVSAEFVLRGNDWTTHSDREF